MSEHAEIEAIIKIAARNEGDYAIAWALLQVADQLGDIGMELREIAKQLETE